ESILREIRPPGSQPTPRSTVGFEEFVDPAFSDTTNVIKLVTTLPDALRVELAARRGAGDRARFKVLYRVFWRREDGQTAPAPPRPPLPPQEPLVLLRVAKDN